MEIISLLVFLRNIISDIIYLDYKANIISLVISLASNIKNIGFFISNKADDFNIIVSFFLLNYNLAKSYKFNN